MSPAPRTKQRTKPQGEPITPPEAVNEPGTGEGGTTAANPDRELLVELTEAATRAREELANLRRDLDEANAARDRAVSGPPAAPSSAEELAAARAKEISEHDFYCPGCGRLADYPRECTGTATAPHPPIEVVSTEELRGDDESKHTAAPAS